VFVTIELLEQLRHLTAAPDRADALATSLSTLCIDVGVAVPSWMSVSIVLSSPGDADVEVAIMAPGEQDGAQVLSSLAVPLSELDPWDHLIVRARAAGAFLLLAPDLASLLGRALPIVVDRHLDQHLSGTAAAEAFAGRSAVEQAIGVLLDRGLSPPEARQDLQRRARISGSSVAAVARSLLDAVAVPRDPDPDGQ
jgi:hypothetical protein